MTSLKLIFTTGLLLLLAACGGGGGGSSTNTVSGIASAGIISGGTVKVFQPYSSLTGADKKELGTPATTLANGSYSVNIGSYSGPVIVEVTGGTYTDEATNAPVPGGIPANAPLRAALSSVSGTVTAAVTPLTELAVKQAKALDKHLGAASIATANAQVSDLFKVDIINTAPLDASGSISAGTPAQQDYTLELAAISQLSKSGDVSLDAALSTLATSISPSGAMTAGAASSLTTALTSFLADATDNKTGVGVSTAPPLLGGIGTTTFKVTLALTGTGVRSVETTITLPAGVTVSADATGATLASVFTLPSGSTITSELGAFAATSPATLHLIMSSPSAAIGTGDIVTLNFNVAAGAAVPTAAAFTLSSTELKDINGVVVAGAALALQ